MTTSIEIRNKLLEERGHYTASELAKRYRISEATVYKIWHNYGGTFKAPAFRNPIYRVVYRAMWRFEHPPYNSIRPLFIKYPEEEAVIDLLDYFREYGAEVLDVLKDHYEPDDGTV